MLRWSSSGIWRWWWVSRPVRPRGRIATRLLLATGLVAGAVLVLAAAAASRHSYKRTRIATAASPFILVLDVLAVTAVLLLRQP